MSYEVAYGTPVVEWIDGRKHVYVLITETGGGAADEWEVDVPTFITVQVDAKLTVAGGATTIDPELGVGASFVADERGPSTVTAAAAVFNPIGETASHMLIPPGTKLRGRSKPNGTAGTVVTHLGYVEGWI